MATTQIEYVASVILSAVSAEIHEASQVSGSEIFLPGKIFLAPGSTVAWDECCSSGGQLYVQISRVYPSHNFPEPYKGRCPAQFAVQFTVGVIRCAHTVNDYGQPPADTELTGDALQTYDDAVLIWQALTSPEVEAKVSTLRLLEWTPQGPQGGCVGGEWSGVFSVSCLSYTPEEVPEATP